MRIVQTFTLTFLLTVIAFGISAAISLNPGNYEIKNWIELPSGGSSKVERRVDYISGDGKELSKLYSESGCEVLFKNETDSALAFELKCNNSGMERILGNFTFMGDSFEGSFLYVYKKGSGKMKVGMRGKRIGGTPESKPQRISAKKLDETDEELRRLWSTMISYAGNGNFDKALELFHPIKRKDQAVIFKELKNEWPRLIKEQIEFRRVDINDERGFARYELVTNEQDGKHRYGILFQKDQNDHWYIVEF